MAGEPTNLGGKIIHSVMTSKDQCGFLIVIYFLELNNSEEAHTFSNKHGIAFNKRQFGIKRKAARIHLQKNATYINSNAEDERERFTSYFSQGNFNGLSNSEKAKHSLRKCQQCQSKHGEHFVLKRGNSCTNSTQTPHNLRNLAIFQKTPEQITKNDVEAAVKDIVLPMKKAIGKTPLKGHFLKRVLGRDKVNDLDQISKTAKRALLQSETKSIKEKAVEKDCVALFSSKVSANEWKSLNRDSFGEIRKNRIKSHTGCLGGYRYNRVQLADALENGVVGNWTKLSQSVGLVRKCNNLPPINAGQVRHYNIIHRCNVMYNNNLINN